VELVKIIHQGGDHEVCLIEQRSFTVPLKCRLSKFTKIVNILQVQNIKEG
jgi:hypothetical protein